MSEWSADGGPGTRRYRGSPTQIETNGLNVVPEPERRGKASDLFWPWFAINISLFGVSYAAFIFYAGVSLAQGLFVAVVGILASFLVCGVVALAGKRASAPTMVVSRAAFGVRGNRVPGVVSWLLSIGWETVLCILAVLATRTILTALGWDAGTPTLVVATLLVAGAIVVFSVLGYHAIIRMQSVITWVTAALTIVFIAMTVGELDLSTAAADFPAGSAQAVLGALLLVMTAFGLGWVNIASDWSRYLPRSTPGRSVVGWNTLGGALPCVVLVGYGLLLSASRPDLIPPIGADPIGALAGLLPTWMLLPFLLLAVLGLVSGAVQGIYSSGLTLLSLGVKISRPAAAFVDGVLLTVGTLYVVFAAETFIGPFQGFLITLGVPIAAWAGVMMADIVLRRRDYDEPALYDPRGRYGSITWSSVLLVIGATILGWGLVVNAFSTHMAGDAGAAWLDWQGFLLGPLGGRDGAWAGANVGVALALVIGFVGYLILRGGAVRRQEAGAPPVAQTTGADAPTPAP